MSESLRSVRLVNFKGFPDHTISLRKSNVLVGANNAGKSTALSALRLVVAMLRTARRTDPTVVAPVDGQMLRGWPVTRAAVELSAFSVENLRHDFRLAETRVEVATRSGARLVVGWPEIEDIDEPPPGGVFFVFPPDGSGATFRQAARDAVPEVGSVPTLTPLDDRETSVTSETLRRHATGRRSSRYFRNIMYSLSRDDWVEFASFVYERTPELTNLSIHRSYGAQDSDFDLFYSEPDTGHEREIGWAGDGVQIWIQLLYHLWLHRNADVVLLDEPDVFLHPDLQRRLARTLFEGDWQVVVATHSIEILAESEPGSAIWVDRSRRTSERPRSDGALGLVGRRLGSGYELGVGRALRSNAVLFVEGDDAPVIAHLARRAGHASIANSTNYATVPLGGFSRNWRAGAFAETMAALGHSVRTFVILDSDLRTAAAVETEIAPLRSANATVHVWKRRELENYLLEASVVSRVSGLDRPATIVLLEQTFLAHRDEAAVAFDSQRLEEAPRHLARSTVLAAARDEFRDRWNSADGPVSLVDAKSVIRGLNSEFQRRGLRTLNVHSLAKEFRRADMTAELLDLLDQLDTFVNLAPR